jgi:hypothetical protein
MVYVARKEGTRNAFFLIGKPDMKDLGADRRIVLKGI